VGEKGHPAVRIYGHVAIGARGCCNADLLGKLGEDIVARILRIGNVGAGCGAIDDLRIGGLELGEQGVDRLNRCGNSRIGLLAHLIHRRRGAVQSLRQGYRGGHGGAGEG
jgi:hypothetical protein